MHTYATDLVAFSHPGFWGFSAYEEIAAHAAAKPRAFWDAILDALAAAGVPAFEITFAPFNIASVQAGFGSAAGFRAALAGRGLQLESGFITDGPVWGPDTDADAVAEDFARRAEFVAEAGATIMVRGLPMRRTLGVQPPFFVDLPFMTKMADLAHRAGEAALRSGVRVAYHTESSSALWYERDIDLFMALTDPRYVHLCPDACHINLGGGEAVRTARRHAPRILTAHWKDSKGVIPEDFLIDDAIFIRQQEFMVEIGQGSVDWHGWIDAIAQTPAAARPIMLEVEGTPDPVAGLIRARDTVDALFAAHAATGRSA